HGSFLSFDPPAQQGTAAPPPAVPQGPVTTEAERRQLVDSLIARLPESRQAEARAEAEKEIGLMTPQDAAALQRFAHDPCDATGVKLDLGPFQDEGPRLQDACRKIVKDSQGFGRAVFQNIPRTMFVFLPLIALLMSVLYVRSGRFYVEHLLFFVHYHAFF